MEALLARHRLGVSVVESVDDPAQVEQIVEPAESPGIIRRRSPGLPNAPVGPVSRNQRPAAVRQDHKKKENAASPEAADHGKRLAFKGMALADDGHRTRNIPAVGSLWPLPSTAWTTTG